MTAKIGKIEHGKPIPNTQGHVWNKKFDQMKPGDSFYFEGVNPINVMQSYRLWMAKGGYSITKDGKGYRFYLRRGRSQ